MPHDNPLAHDGDVNRPSDAVPPAEPHLPELVAEMLHVRMADTLQAHGLDTLPEAQKSRLPILRQGGDFGIHDGAQGLHGPRHRAARSGDVARAVRDRSTGSP